MTDQNWWANAPVVSPPRQQAPQPRPQAQPQAYRPSYSGPLPSRAEDLFPALIQQESGGRAGVMGPQTRYGRAIGRTQMLPETAREMATKLGVPFREDLLRGTSQEAAAYQDRLGMAYLQQGFEQTGNARDALHYYHGGPDRRLWGPKTRAYADSILSMAANGQGQAPVQAEAMPSDGWWQTAPVVDDAAAAEAATTYGTSSPDIGEVVVDRGVQNINGRAVERGGNQPDRDLGPWDQYMAGLEQSRQERIARMERESNPEYQAQYDRAQNGIDNVPDAVSQVLAGQTLGGNGIVPYLTGAVSYVDAALSGQDAGLASQAARDATRDHMDTFAQEHPGQSLGYQLLGGLFTPGLKGAGDYIGGAQGAERIGRAAVVGGGMGAASGVLNATGDAGNRAKEGLLGGAVGLATGGLLDAATQRAFGGAARAIDNPSNARLLSRQGVQLTPGQMLENTPVVGGLLRGLEDASSSIPGVGSAVQGARNESLESFNRVALNRALAPIGERLPNKAAVGYEGVSEVQRRLGAAYDAILPRVSAQLDQPLYDDIARVLDNAAAEMQPAQVEQLGRVLQNRVFRNFDQADATITGEQFKRIESELGALARDYRTATDPTARSFGQAVEDIRGALRDMVARQNPAEANRIQAINAGYANLVRLENAAGSNASQAAEGVFTPTQLGVAVSKGASRSQKASGDALLQDLAVAGRSVLPNKIGDSGTAARGAVTAILGGGAAGLLSPQLAIPVVAAGVAYSKPAQTALNAIYRATDRRTAESALGQLARFAGRNPALQPYYQAAAEAVRSSFGNREQGRAPASAGLLSPIPTP